MANLNKYQWSVLEEFFKIPPGYVRGFTNRTFSDFFREVLEIEIYDDKYAIHGDSKWLRLRAFFETERDHLVGKAILELIDYLKYHEEVLKASAGLISLSEECRRIACELQGKAYQASNVVKVSSHAVGIDKVKLIAVGSVAIDDHIVTMINQRLEEINQIDSSKCPLSIMILCGSALEGLFWGLAQKEPTSFNQAKASPRDREGKPRLFKDWTLNEWIIVAQEIGYLGSIERELGCV